MIFKAQKCAVFKSRCHQFMKIVLFRAFVQDFLNQGGLVVGLVRLRHHFCAMKDLLGHAQMLRSMCSGMDSTPLNPLMKSWPKVYWNRGLISSLEATHSCTNSLLTSFMITHILHVLGLQMFLFPKFDYHV